MKDSSNQKHNCNCTYAITFLMYVNIVKVCGSPKLSYLTLTCAHCCRLRVVDKKSYFQNQQSHDFQPYLGVNKKLFSSKSRRPFQKSVVRLRHCQRPSPKGVRIMCTVETVNFLVHPPLSGGFNFQMIPVETTLRPLPPSKSTNLLLKITKFTF